MLGNKERSRDKKIIMEMSTAPFNEEPSPLRANKNGSAILSTSSPFFHHTSSKPTDSAPSQHVLNSSGVGNRRENFISFQQFLSPRGSMGANIEPGFMRPYFMEEKPCAAKKNRRRENPVSFFTNEDCSETVFLPSQKRKRANAKPSGNDENAEKSAGQKRNGNKGRSREGQPSPLTNQADHSQSILGMYGLDARTLDLSEYVNDISLEHLMSHQPGVSQKQEIQRPTMNNNSFGTHVNTILHNNMARPPQGESSAPSTSMPKPVDNKPHRFMLDLESPPVDENEEKALHDMNNVQSFSSGSKMLFLDSRKPQQLSTQFPADTSYLHADFLNISQLPSNESLECSMSQVGVPSENKFSSCHMVQPSHENINRIPPTFFSFNSGQAVQHENSCDPFTNSRMNIWCKPAPPTMAPLQNGLLQTCVGNRFPFAVEPEIVETKSVKKIGMHRAAGFDIDLNKQSSEAEAAESILDTAQILAQSSSPTPPEPIIEKNVLGALSTVMTKEKQPDTPMMSIYPNVDQPTVANQVINRATVVDEDVPTPAVKLNEINVVKDGAEDEKSKDPGSQPMCILELQEDKQENAIDKQDADSVCSPNNPVTASPENETDKQENSRIQGSEAMETAIASVSNSFPRLSLPDGQETEDGWNDVPYSPGVQATARLLCKMASSSSPFYVENEDGGALSLQKGTSPIQRHRKTTKIGVHGLGNKASEEKNWAEKNLTKVPLKAQAREGEDQTMCNDKDNSSTHSNVKRNGLIHAPHESRPVTSLATKARNSPSSESDGSPNPTVRENTINEVYGKVNRIRSDQLYISGSSKVSTNPSIIKEGKVTHTVGSNTKPLFNTPSKGSSSVQRKNEMTNDRKQSIQGDGFSKLRHPHTSSSKSCLTSQKTSSNYSVKPGFPAKTPRQVLPFVGEIRYGSK